MSCKTLYKPDLVHSELQPKCVAPIH